MPKATIDHSVASTEYTTTLSGFDSETDYTVHFTLEDAAGNLRTDVNSGVTFTTADVTGALRETHAHTHTHNRSPFIAGCVLSLQR